MYASFLGISEALHLAIFHQPLRCRFFDSLISICESDPLPLVEDPALGRVGMDTNKIEVFKERDEDMKVIVQDNQIEKAIRDLKKKLTKEGFFSEIKERRFYDKPSVQKKKKQAKAAKRRRKRMKKFY